MLIKIRSGTALRTWLRNGDSLPPVIRRMNRTGETDSDHARYLGMYQPVVKLRRADKEALMG